MSCSMGKRPLHRHRVEPLPITVVDPCDVGLERIVWIGVSH